MDLRKQIEVCPVAVVFKNVWCVLVPRVIDASRQTGR
jgi:hypothetical protein